MIRNFILENNHQTASMNRLYITYIHKIKFPLLFKKFQSKTFFPGVSNSKPSRQNLNENETQKMYVNGHFRKSSNQVGSK